MKKLNFNQPFKKLDGSNEAINMHHELAAMLRAFYQQEPALKLHEKIAREELAQKVFSSSSAEYSGSEIECIKHVLEITPFVSSAAQIAMYISRIADAESKQSKSLPTKKSGGTR